MTLSTHLRCIRCHKAFTLADCVRACDRCLAEGVSANLSVAYAPRAPLHKADLPARPQSMWRYAALLHASADEAVSLGEGLTPLLAVPSLGLGPLWIKDESQNPTWSFKDRLASAAITMAKKMGARVVVSSSSGNAGAATAAYAARAGLPCIVLATQHAGGAMLTQMATYGAMLLKVPTSEQRWQVLSAGVQRFGWFPTTAYFGPTVGSNPLGIEGYKTIAYEIAEARGWQVPDWCAVPACYGDSLYGLYKGFEELRAMGWTDRIPRLLAAEVSGSLAQAMLDGLDMPSVRDFKVPSVARSIDAPRGTYQALAALRASGGRALQVANADILAWQNRLARREGLYAEAAAAAILPAIEKLRADGTIVADASVVALLTASGLKDNSTAEQWLAPVPLIEPSLDAAMRALKEHYGHVE